MPEMLPKEVREALAQARKHDLRRNSRLRLHTGEDIFPVLRYWQSGFSLDAKDEPHLRGLVDLYEGSRHLYQCLVVASREENGEVCYEFKRSTAAKDSAPLDFERAPDAPIALLGR